MALPAVLTQAPPIGKKKNNTTAKNINKRVKKAGQETKEKAV